MKGKLVFMLLVFSFTLGRTVIGGVLSIGSSKFLDGSCESLKNGCT